MVPSRSISSNASHGVDGLHDHVGLAVTVVIDDLQPVAVLVLLDVNSILVGLNVLIHEDLPGDIGSSEMSSLD